MAEKNTNKNASAPVGLIKRLVRSIHFHKKDGGWIYIAFGSWQPFKWLIHSGWICLNIKWIWRFAVVVLRMRGWRLG